MSREWPSIKSGWKGESVVWIERMERRIVMGCIIVRGESMAMP